MGRVVLGSIIDKIGEMSKTSELERLLLGIAYWLGVIIVILFVFLSFVFPIHGIVLLKVYDK